MPASPRHELAVPLTVTALELSEGRVTHVQGRRHGGLRWRLALDEALAAIEGRRYSLGMRSGRERVELVRRDDLARRFEARDRFGRDLVLELPVITRQAHPPASCTDTSANQGTASMGNRR